MSDTDRPQAKASLRLTDDEIWAFGTPAEDMPAGTARHHESTMRWVRFTPEARVLSWDNATLIGGT